MHKVNSDELEIYLLAETTWSDITLQLSAIKKQRKIKQKIRSDTKRNAKWVRRLSNSNILTLKMSSHYLNCHLPNFAYAALPKELYQFHH